MKEESKRGIDCIPVSLPSRVCILRFLNVDRQKTDLIDEKLSDFFVEISEEVTIEEFGSMLLRLIRIFYLVTSTPNEEMREQFIRAIDNGEEDRRTSCAGVLDAEGWDDWIAKAEEKFNLEGALQWTHDHFGELDEACDEDPRALLIVDRFWRLYFDCNADSAEALAIVVRAYLASEEASEGDDEEPEEQPAGEDGEKGETD